MGPPESPTSHPENQEGRRKRMARRPRMRRCLLKGCEQRFHPRQARQRYCSAKLPGGGAEMVAVEGAATIPGDGSGPSRNGTGKAGVTGSASKAGNAPEPETVSEAARVITTEHFFRAIAATGPAATRDSRASGEVPCNASARRRAGARWSAFGSGSGAGGRRAT